MKNAFPSLALCEKGDYQLQVQKISEILEQNLLKLQTAEGKLNRQQKELQERKRLLTSPPPFLDKDAIQTYREEHRQELEASRNMLALQESRLKDLEKRLPTEDFIPKRSGKKNTGAAKQRSSSGQTFGKSSSRLSGYSISNPTH